MLLLLIACACGVYLWHHAPALLLLLGGIGILWYVVIPLVVLAAVAIPLGLLWGETLLSWLANALPDIPGLTHPFSWERRWTAPLPTSLWTALGLAAFVLLSVLAHTLLPR